MPMSQRSEITYISQAHQLEFVHVHILHPPAFIIYVVSHRYNYAFAYNMKCTEIEKRRHKQIAVDLMYLIH